VQRLGSYQSWFKEDLSDTLGKYGDIIVSMQLRSYGEVSKKLNIIRYSTVGSKRRNNKLSKAILLYWSR
jgi:hypothetical protein